MFKNKTAIITGGASGMGLLCGQKLAEQGANVVLADINEAALKEKCAEINALGNGKAEYSVADVRNYEQVVATVKLAVDKFKTVDYMINCAGGAEVRMLNKPGIEFKDMPIEVYDWSLDVNLRGVFYFNHAVMKYMAEQMSGVIINIGSISGIAGDPNNVGYATSKTGVMDGLTQSMAQYAARYNVRVCCVTPGPILTRPGMAELPTMMGRAGEPIEVVDMILYLISDKAAFITGTNYIVDGGFSASGRPGKYWRF